MTIGPAFFASTVGVTLNPSDKHANIALSSGNMVATKTTSDAGPVSVRATLGRSASDTGYFEVYVGEGTTSTFMIIGLSTTGLLVANFCGSNSTSWGYYQDTGQKYTNNAASAYGSTWKTNGLVLGVSLNNGSIEFLRNNVSQGVAFTGVTGTLFPTLSLYRANAPTHQLGFRGRTADFVYGPPSGVGAWDR